MKSCNFVEVSPIPVVVQVSCHAAGPNPPAASEHVRHSEYVTTDLGMLGTSSGI